MWYKKRQHFCTQISLQKLFPDNKFETQGNSFLFLRLRHFYRKSRKNNLPPLVAKVRREKRDQYNFKCQMRETERCDVIWRREVSRPTNPWERRWRGRTKQNKTKTTYAMQGQAEERESVGRSPPPSRSPVSFT